MSKRTSPEQPAEDRLNAVIARDIKRVRRLQKLSRDELAARAGLHGAETVEALEDAKKHKAHQLPQLVAVYKYLQGQQGPELEPQVARGLAEVRMRLEELLLAKLPVTEQLAEPGRHSSPERRLAA